MQKKLRDDFQTQNSPLMESVPFASARMRDLMRLVGARLNFMSNDLLLKDRLVKRQEKAIADFVDREYARGTKTLAGVYNVMNLGRYHEQNAFKDSFMFLEHLFSALEYDTIYLDAEYSIGRECGFGLHGNIDLVAEEVFAGEHFIPKILAKVFPLGLSRRVSFASIAIEVKSDATMQQEETDSDPQVQGRWKFLCRTYMVVL